eukprot:TRINITY_DN3717_c0_g1_i1.p1 TRINITY_DN3717_c0_g1~~TRINITY_DN3717_c0_g1_i1.p1  ORF type:complete len:188 (+),score=14.04 TRINITY_DN3717_c0_g1_i1:64-627(+)
MPEFGRLNNVRNKPQAQVCTSVVGPIIGVLISLAIGIPAVIIGYQDNDCEKPIDEWLRVTGIITLATAAIQLLMIPIGFVNAKNTIAAAGTADEGQTTVSGSITSCWSCITSILGCFWIAWYIVGSIWYFTNDDTASNDCPSEIEDMTFALLIIFYMCCGCGLVSLCLLVFGLCCIMGAAGLDAIND